MNASDQNQRRDPAEIEREIRDTQRDMGRTVDQIEDQLTPRNLLNALLDKADEQGIDARYLMDGARRNPLALGMIAIGGIWLVSDSDARASTLKPSGLSGSSGSPAHDDFHRGYIEHMNKCEPRADEDELAYRRRRDLTRANYLMIEQRHDEDEKSFRDRLDEATEALRERRDGMLERAHQMGDSARDSASNLSGKAQRAYRENPLIGGLVAATIGALAGSAVPVSRTEEEQFGKLGADALDTAKEKGRELGEQARQKKDEAVDKAERKMDEGDASSGSASQQRTRQYDPV